MTHTGHVVYKPQRQKPQKKMRTSGAAKPINAQEDTEDINGGPMIIRDGCVRTAAVASTEALPKAEPLQTRGKVCVLGCLFPLQIIWPILDDQ